MESLSSYHLARISGVRWHFPETVLSMAIIHDGYSDSKPDYRIGSYFKGTFKGSQGMMKGSQ